MLSVLRTNVVLRVLVYYAVLVTVTVLAWTHLPHSGAFARESMDALFGNGPAVTRKTTEAPMDQTTLAVTVALAMTCSVLLSLPVAWVYVLTRAKRGYQQSVVQSLMILPLLVAGVVALVKYSLALAFSLAGIVAAVRFRNTLEDSKDAVYIFLATAIGLAAAVDLPVAFVISIIFNIVVLLLWHFEFGRSPSHLEGGIAKRKLERALETLSRTGTFISRLDHEVLQDMTAEQLEALSDRARHRSRRNSPDEPDADGKRESILRVHTADADGSRLAIEPMMNELFKKWRYGGSVRAGEGVQVLEYEVSLKKRSAPDDILEALRRRGTPHVLSAELE